jgi:hypothetical protein
MEYQKRGKGRVLEGEIESEGRDRVRALEVV